VRNRGRRLAGTRKAAQAASLEAPCTVLWSETVRILARQAYTYLALKARQSGGGYAQMRSIYEVLDVLI